MSDQQFVHLHTHSHYSLLEAIPKIDALIERAKADGQTALALTDNGSLYGAIEFYKEAKKAGIQPILGVDFFVSPRTRHDKEHRVDDRTSRLVLLAKNDVGYHNLIHLVSKSFLEGFYYRPRIDRELLETFSDGLVAIIPSFSGSPVQALKDGQDEKAHESAAWYKKIFRDDCYMELTHHPEIEGHETRMKQLCTLAQQEHIALVATGDCYYLDTDDALARELVNKIRTGAVLNRESSLELPDFAFMTQESARKRFKHIPEALKNTIEIKEKCQLDLALGKWVFPDFPIPPGRTHDEELRTLAERGVAHRGFTDTPELHARLDYELSVISQKGYSSYFLVVADLLRYAREAGIYTNTRGSAAGSLVSYLCGITTVDPIAFNMPFERFLNPERPSPPDIDMDLADDRRDDLIEYARKKYGADHVAQVGTFGTMMARAAVRDVSRALGHSYGTGDRVAKLIPFGKQGFPVTIAGALDEVQELKDAYKTDADAREILDLATVIEGNARHVGVHAAGVFITPKPIEEYVPIQLDPKGGKIITQYDMYSAGEDGLGLLKFDFLGLKNLSVLADAVARVKARHNIILDLDRIPLDDPKTFSMLAKGNTLGVFQLSSDGMTAYLVELKPTTIHDINAMVALYRPGPMGFIPEYIERKRDPKRVHYLDPRLEPILKDTFGILIYQDDLLLVVSKLAGYTMGQADKFRRAVGKKIPEEMAAQKGKFIDGCVEHGMKLDIAQKLWEQIETFAAYGFNKAHAASYGNLAYKTAFLKANYPVDYMSALLTGDAGEVEKIGEIVDECKKMNIAVLAPNVNESRGTFTVIDDAAIRFGLYSIKNFGTGVADSIIAVREHTGRFTSLADFLARVTDKNLNKKSLEALIQSGALDEFGERGMMLAHIELLLTYHKESSAGPQNQSSLFSQTALAPLTLPPAPEATMSQKLSWEKELLGLYVSGHPLDEHKEKFAKIKHDIKSTKNVLPEGVTTVIGGLIQSANVILTKKGDKMAFLTIADFRDEVEVVVFPTTYKDHSAFLTPGTCVLIKGKMTSRNGEKSFVTEAVKKL